MFLLLLALGVCYLLILALLWTLQDMLVFPGAGRGDRAIEVPGVEVTQLNGLDGLPFRVATAKPRSQPRAVMLCFVGNGEDLRSAAWHVSEWAAYGMLALAPEYPGYGLSEGKPGVASLLACADATAALAQERARQLGVPFLVAGTSLGTFCAVHVAAQGVAERLLLRSPPTTLVDAALARFWWLPVGSLLRHRFDSLALAPQVQCPVLVLHGDRDGIVPAALGERLCAAFGGPARFELVSGAAHNNLSLAHNGPQAGIIKTFLFGS